MKQTFMKILSGWMNFYKWYMVFSLKVFFVMFLIIIALFLFIMWRMGVF